ncbi:MAG: AHH domain-containing protein [bacterium]|nr:AHH domain-containing protein [Candidatus Kapabacteria bacterium]
MSEAKEVEHQGVLAKCESTLTKCDAKKYIANTTDGFRKPNPQGKRKKKWEAHHVICGHSMAARKTTDYVEKCLRITDWDINATPNMIGLPRNRQFRYSDGVTPGGFWVSHQVDHNTSDGYTEECRKELQKMFNRITKGKDDHSSTPTNIKSELEKITTKFLDLLEERWARGPGDPKQGWDKRLDNTCDDWYEPFSMAKVPRERIRGTKTNVQDALKQAFE